MTAAFLFFNLSFVLLTLLITWNLKKLAIFVRTTLSVRRLWSTLCTRFRFNYWLSKSLGSVISFFVPILWLFVLSAALLSLNLYFVRSFRLVLWPLSKLSTSVRSTLIVKRHKSNLCTWFRINYWLSKSLGSVISFFVTIYDYLFWQPHFCHWLYVSSLRFAWFYGLRVNCLFLLEEFILKDIRVICVHDFDSILDSQGPLALS